MGCVACMVACSGTRKTAAGTSTQTATTIQATASQQVSAPLFIDPHYHGSCDPEIIWSREQKLWYIFYTARKGNQENTFTGTPLGVITSPDLVHWDFKGYCKFDGIGGKKDSPATYWAPAIIADNGMYHMFVTFKPDTLPTQGPWGGPSRIVHYQAKANDLVNGWKKVADMHGSELDALDATVYQKDGLFHLWFKGKKKGEKNELYSYISQNMYDWKAQGISKSDVFNQAASGSDFEEAPYMFHWKGIYWLITDPHKGLFVYSSMDAASWKFQGTILEAGGTRPMDTSMARHCSIAVIGDRAFIVYHVEPWRDYSGKVPIFKQPTTNRRSVLQMAELKLEGGKLTCNRNE